MVYEEDFEDGQGEQKQKEGEVEEEYADEFDA